MKTQTWFRGQSSMLRQRDGKHPQITRNTDNQESLSEEGKVKSADKKEGLN